MFLFHLLYDLLVTLVLQFLVDGILYLVLDHIGIIELSQTFGQSLGLLDHHLPAVAQETPDLVEETFQGGSETAAPSGSTCTGTAACTSSPPSTSSSCTTASTPSTAATSSSTCTTSPRTSSGSRRPSGGGARHGYPHCGCASTERDRGQHRRFDPGYNIITVIYEQRPMGFAAVCLDDALVFLGVTVCEIHFRFAIVVFRSVYGDIEYPALPCLRIVILGCHIEHFAADLHQYELDVEIVRILR